MMQVTQNVVTSKPIMLTIPQLEAMQILPGRAIRRLVAEGRIPTIKVGNRRYINYTLFERYLLDGQVEASTGK